MLSAFEIKFAIYINNKNLKIIMFLNFLFTYLLELLNILVR